MTTGRLAIGALRLVLQNWLLSAVNSSGAVSPLMRAIGQQDAGDHAGLGGAVGDLRMIISAARQADRGRRLAQRVGHQQQHVLGGAHDHRNDDHGQRHRAGPAGEMAHRLDHDLVDEQADDDRRRAEQDVVDEAHDRGQRVVAAVLGHVGAGQDADRRADRDGKRRS